MRSETVHIYFSEENMDIYKKFYEIYKNEQIKSTRLQRTTMSKVAIKLLKLGIKAYASEG